MTHTQDERKRLTAHFGRTLREARKRASMTQVDVAELLGVATDVYGRMERGSMLPSVPKLRKLCRLLRMDANVLLGLDAEKASMWPENPPPEVEESPELRRLTRMLRQMDAARLAVVLGTVSALMKHTSSQPDEPFE